jgi:hypothetical protein
MVTEGVWAEAKVGGEHLRLFSEHNVKEFRHPFTTLTLRSGLLPQSLWMISNKVRIEQQNTRELT